MAASTFKLKVKVSSRVGLPSGEVGRGVFFEWAWQEFGSRGLMGVHEGTMLSDQAFEAGLETESFTVDSGEAPRERDWIGHGETAEAELYFDTEVHARDAAEELRGLSGVVIGAVEEQPDQDWDAEWKASFQGIDLAPYWQVLPPWKGDAIIPGRRILRINPGAGFGTGTHETTQLCLTALAEAHASRAGLFKGDCLDFGSGSGILAIGAALLGAQVDAVEIDELAIDNARENARLNGVESMIRYSKNLPPARAYPIVIANILKPVLMEFAPALCARLSAGGLLVLSGLVDADVEPIVARFESLLPPGFAAPRVGVNGEWRSVVFVSSGPI